MLASRNGSGHGGLGRVAISFITRVGGAAVKRLSCCQPLLLSACRLFYASKEQLLKRRQLAGFLMTIKVIECVCCMSLKFIWYTISMTHDGNVMKNILDMN